MTPDDPMWDDLFHGCAFDAFVAEAKAAEGWPDGAAVKREAYRLYETEQEGKKAGPATAASPVPPPASRCP